MTTYTVITFAPVQGFIEKSRKLRDLYGASQILSYLSYCLVKEAGKKHGLTVISPAIKEGELSNDLIQGMPNRILIVGEIERDHAFNLFRNTLYSAWEQLVRACKSWVEKKIPGSYDWNMSWKRWEMHAWEIFLGQDASITDAMKDLETRKLRRGWTVPNWNGESSSLSGHDGIAYPNMDRRITPKKERDSQNQSNPQDLTQEIKAFYKAIAEKLDPSGTENDRAYINENERLSVPELIKRLVTYSEIRDSIDFYRVIPAKDKKAFELEGFTKLLRKDEKKPETYWTGWFMGDGDRIGNYLKSLSDPNQVREFSLCLRDWGHKFKQFDLGRVVYAGGDDFLGVIYGTDETPQRDRQEVVDWLCGLRGQWEELRDAMREKGLRVNDGEEPDVSLSVGFVWAGHSVPQRDVLQHCREAEKLAKNLGRDRVTIRVVFNNGQYVQWTTPWQYLAWLKDYRDRDGESNWSHVYSDLAELKARHAISPKGMKEADSRIALELFKLYFGEKNSSELSRKRSDITNKEEPRALIEWIEGMIQVGWQLCSNG
jgi:CRISPR-associated protein Cmr2